MGCHGASRFKRSEALECEFGDQYERDVPKSSAICGRFESMEYGECDRRQTDDAIISSSCLTLTTEAIYKNKNPYSMYPYG
jgi:hypothetical protein